VPAKIAIETGPIAVGGLVNATPWSRRRAYSASRSETSGLRDRVALGEELLGAIEARVRAELVRRCAEHRLEHADEMERRDAGRACDRANRRRCSFGGDEDVARVTEAAERIAREQPAPSLSTARAERGSDGQALEISIEEIRS
jgi:hypothetical protein